MQSAACKQQIPLYAKSWKTIAFACVHALACGQRLGDPRDGTKGAIVYTPDVLKHQRFVISPETQANTARAERALVRMEEKALNGHVSGSLRRVLSRLEAISTIRIEGKAPRLATLLQLEACVAESGDALMQQGDPFDFLGFENEEERQIAVEVLFFERALEYIYRTPGIAAPFDLGYLLDIHSLARFGCPASASGVGFM